MASSLALLKQLLTPSVIGRGREAVQAGLRTSAVAFAGAKKEEGGVPAVEDDVEHVTGLERIELDTMASKGDDLFGDNWLEDPEPGTPEKPVEVTSIFSERIIGVTDPHDDSEVLWGVIKEGEPPKQICPGGEYFVLKMVEPEAH